MFDLGMLQNVDLGKLMEIMEKYKNIDIKEVKIKIDKYDDAIVFKILTDSNKIGDMMSDILPLVLGNIPEENLQIKDHRG